MDDCRSGQRLHLRVHHQQGGDGQEDESGCSCAGGEEYDMAHEGVGLSALSVCVSGKRHGMGQEHPRQESDCHPNRYATQRVGESAAGGMHHHESRPVDTACHQGDIYASHLVSQPTFGTQPISCCKQHDQQSDY